MSGYLVDTHIFLWSLYAPEKILPEALATIEDQGNTIFVSAAVTLEILIKRAKGNLAFAGSVMDSLYQQSFLPLSITHQQLIVIEQLPLIHHDPFDRIMIAQAIAEDLVLITRDKTILKYENVKLLKG